MPCMLMDCVSRKKSKIVDVWRILSKQKSARPHADPGLCSTTVPLTFYTKPKCWAPRILRLEALGLPVIFLRAQPCDPAKQEKLFPELFTLIIIIWGQVWSK